MKQIKSQKNLIHIGLKENRALFSLLVVINLFVGSMVGLERVVLPLLGEKNFGIASASSALSFIISFGFSKAFINLMAGRFADLIGRKKVLIIGWVIGLFVPLIVMMASSWWWVVFANILLGINQGLTWSMTVNMKVDLVTPDERGLAIGLNEFAGYLGVAAASFGSSYLAATYLFGTEIFLVGMLFAVIGLLLSLMVKSTEPYLQLQKQSSQQSPSHHEMSMVAVFRETTWKNRSLSSLSFAGLSTNLKDGMAWGLFPLFLVQSGMVIGEVGVIVAVYPAAWGVFQLFTGSFSDRVGRKWLIAVGMWLQAGAIWWIVIADLFVMKLSGAVLLGLGTAMVYPTLQAAISDVAAPDWRASAMGVYRFWRDSGYAFGAILAGTLADQFGLRFALILVAIIPLLAGLLVAVQMKETRRKNSGNKKGPVQ